MRLFAPLALVALIAAAATVHAIQLTDGESDTKKTSPVDSRALAAAGPDLGGTTVRDHIPGLEWDEVDWNTGKTGEDVMNDRLDYCNRLLGSDNKFHKCAGRCCYYWSVGSLLDGDYLECMRDCGYSV